LTFNNPLKRSLKRTDKDGKEKCVGIESARLLVKHIFDDEKREKNELEQRILMQAVPKVLEAYKSGEVTLKDFDQFFRNDDTKYSFF